MNETMIIYCDGRTGDRHPRRVLREFRRRDDGTWFVPHTGDPSFRYGELASRADYPEHKQLGDRIRFRCTDCRPRLDEKRNLGRRYDVNYPPFDTEFEKLRAAGVDAIDVRTLVVVVWS